jgi:hypothetical protein
MIDEAMEIISANFSKLCGGGQAASQRTVHAFGTLSPAHCHFWTRLALPQAAMTVRKNEERC